MQENFWYNKYVRLYRYGGAEQIIKKEKRNIHACKYCNRNPVGR